MDLTAGNLANHLRTAAPAGNNRQVDDDAMSSFMGSETSETRRMNKFERALLRFPLSMAWNGANLYDGTTQLRRVRTQAMNEQSEHLPKITAHYDQLIHAGEICLAPMLQNKLEDIKVHITAAVLADDPAVQPEAKLPKNNFMEWCCRKAADHMPPIHSPPTDENWKSCFKMVALYKEGEKVAYSVDAAEAWCDLYSSDDMTSGHPIDIFIIFWETHVLSPLFGDPEGENVNRSRICDIADHLLEHTATYPEEYSTDRMKSFQARMRSMLLLFGKTPFQRGAKIEDLSHIHQGTTELQAAMKSSAWAGKLWSSAFMRNAGEVEAEPEITRAEKLMESDSCEDQTRGLESVIENYVGWSLQVRPSWLERSIQDRVVKLLGGRVEQSGVKALTANDSHAASIMATPENMKLVSLVSDISGLWADVRVSMMKQSLAVISCAIERRDAVAAFVKGIEDAVISEDISSTSLVELCRKLIPTLPSRSMVLLLTSGDDQAKVATFLSMLTKCATNMLPATLPHLTDLMKGICNKVEMEALDEDSSEALTSSTAITLYDGEKAKATHYFDLTHLQDLNSKYQELGGTEHSRFTSDASHKLIEQMVPVITRIKHLIIGKEEEGFIVDILQAANKHLEGHTQLAISEANEPLTSSMKLLQECAGGVADGKEWKTILAQEDPSPSPKMLFSKLEHLTKDTLQKVDTQILVQRILETHTVWMCCS